MADEISAATPPMQSLEGVATRVLAGLGLGLLLGLIAGLSVSPVVQTILGALVTVVAGFLTLQSSAVDTGFLNRVRMNELRIGCFGLACVAGIMLGLYARTHDSFGPSMKQQVARWTEAGYSQADALDFVAFQDLGIKPKGTEVAAVDERQKQSQGVLFASALNKDDCQRSDPSQYKHDPKVVLDIFKGLGNDKLTTLAKQIQSSVPDHKQQALVDAAWDALCNSPTKQ